MSQPPSSVFTRAEGVLKVVGRGLGIVSGLLVAAIALFLLFDALSRHILGVSSGASDQIVSVLSAFALAAAFPYALYAGAHIVIEILVIRYPMKLQKILARVVALGMAVFAGIVAYALWTVTARSITSGAMVQSTAVPVWLPQIFAIAALAFLALVALVQAISGSAQTASEAAEAMMEAEEER